jgi:hypothetical protein
MQFGELAGKHPSFTAEEKRRELQRRLDEIPGIQIGADRIGKYPSFPVSALVDSG